MDQAKFDDRARALLQWAQGESSRAFFVNGYLGSKMTYEKGILP